MKVACAGCNCEIDLGSADRVWALDDREIAGWLGRDCNDSDPQEYAWCSRVCCLAWLANVSYEKGADLTPLVIDAYHERKNVA